MIFSLLLLALLLPVVLGLLIRRLCFGLLFKEFFLNFVSDFIFGHCFLSLALFLLSWAGVKLSFAVCLLTYCILLLIAVAACYFLGRFRRFRWRGRGELDWLSLLFFGLMLALLVRIFFYAFAEAATYWPEWSIWGLKAKILYYEGVLSENFWRSEAMDHSQKSYPLAWPLMLMWCCRWMRGFNDHLLQFVPWSFAVLTLGAFVGISRECGLRSWRAFVASLILGGSFYFHYITTRLYVDCLLLLCVLMGFFCLWQSLKKRTTVMMSVGFLFLACSAWIKNEGSMYFAIGCVSYFLLSPKRLKCKLWVNPILWAMIFILPWMIFKSYYVFIPRDFSVVAFGQLWQSGELLSRYWMVIKYFFKSMFVWVFFSGGMWYLLICSFKGKRLFKNRGMLFLCCSILMTLVIYSVAFLFSTREFYWHLWATPRILLVPASLGLIVLIEKMQIT